MLQASNKRARGGGLLCTLAIMLAPATAHAASSADREYDGPTAVASARGQELDLVPLSPGSSGEERTESEQPTDEVPAPRVVTPPAEQRLTGARMVVIDPMKQVRMRPVLDTTIALAAAAPTFALNLWVNRSLPPPPSVAGTEPDVGRFDQLAVGRFEEGQAIDIGSDIAVSLSVAVPVIYHAIEAGTRRHVPRGERGRTFGIAFGTDIVILAQTLAINGLMTEILKAAVRRPRPYAYLSCADVAPDRCDELQQEQQEADANWSFPSGHTSHAFAASTAGATLLTLELVERSNLGIAAAWIGGTALAGTTAALRVLAGKHFGSDVFTSALLGAGIGAAVPLAHWRVPDRAVGSRGTAATSTWSVGPMGGPSVAGISLRGFLH